MTDQPSVLFQLGIHDKFPRVSIAIEQAIGARKGGARVVFYLYGEGVYLANEDIMKSQTIKANARRTVREAWAELVGMGVEIWIDQTDGDYRAGKKHVDSGPGFRRVATAELGAQLAAFDAVVVF